MFLTFLIKNEKKASEFQIFSLTKILCNKKKVFLKIYEIGFSKTCDSRDIPLFNPQNFSIFEPAIFHEIFTLFLNENSRFQKTFFQRIIEKKNLNLFKKIKKWSSQGGQRSSTKI